MENSPSADVVITTELVRALLVEQHPELGELKIEPLATGWDNATYRLGDELLVRLPRRIEGVPLIEFELEWLPQLAPRLPLPIPAAVGLGRPGSGFPWPWAICRFIAGTDGLAAALTEPEGPTKLADFLVALHQAAPDDAPVNPHRGQPLTDRDALTRERMESISDPDLAARVEATWAELVAVEQWDGPPIWLHGDLHPGNVVIDDGRLAGVIDFGDITSGDPACDLMVAWSLLGQGQRAEFRAQLERRSEGSDAPLDDPMWERSRGWAISHALAILPTSADKPSYQVMALRTLTAATSDLI